MKKLNPAPEERRLNRTVRKAMENLRASGEDDIDAWFQLGCAWSEINKHAKAIKCFSEVLIRKDNHSPSWRNTAVCYERLGNFSRAQECFYYALQSEPNLPVNYINLGRRLYMDGKMNEAVKIFRQLIEATGDQTTPALQSSHSYLLFSLLTVESNFSNIVQDLRYFNDRHCKPLQPQSSPAIQPRGKRRIRIGYVSGDLHYHSASRSFGALLTDYDADRFNVFVYSNNSYIDDETRRYRTDVENWCQIDGKNDNQAYNKIKNDEIDILVDCSGHTPGNRLLLFARQPAPIQITGLGFGCSTGMDAMTHMFCDEHILPSDRAEMIPESPLYISSLIHWEPPPEPVPIEYPFKSNGYITFGTGNTLMKITPLVVETWAAIMKQVPGSRFLLKSMGLEDSVIAQRVLDLFVGAGIEPDRVEMRGRTTKIEHLQFYNEIDIALDPFPYQGGVTTCETLYMRKPVVTLNTGTLSSVSVLRNCELDYLILDDIKSYISYAVSLAERIMAQQIPYQKGWMIQDQLLVSPICDTKSFVREVYGHYEKLV